MARNVLRTVSWRLTTCTSSIGSIYMRGATKGQSLVEYSMLISLIAIGLVAAVVLFGRGLNGTYNTILNTLVYANGLS